MDSETDFTDFTISFAGDEVLAQGVYRYLLSHFGFTSYVSTEINEDEIKITLNKNADMKEFKRLLQQVIDDYLQSNKLIGYKIIEFNNIMTVGIPKNINDISSFLMCEICGWRVTTEEELLTHRRTHWI
jgi:hypothetical protein